MDPRAAFRRSSLMLRSPRRKNAFTLNAAGSGPARTAFKNSKADSLANGNGHSNIGIERKYASRTSIGGLQPAQYTSTRTLAVARHSHHSKGQYSNDRQDRQESESIDAIEMSPRLELIKNMRRMEKDAISQCKLVISSMLQAFRRQKNINNEFKVGLSKTKAGAILSEFNGEDKVTSVRASAEKHSAGHGLHHGVKLSARIEIRDLDSLTAKGRWKQKSGSCSPTKRSRYIRGSWRRTRGNKYVLSSHCLQRVPRSSSRPPI